MASSDGLLETFLAVTGAGFFVTAAFLAAFLTGALAAVADATFLAGAFLVGAFFAAAFFAAFLAAGLGLASAFLGADAIVFVTVFLLAIIVRGLGRSQHVQCQTGIQSELLGIASTLDRGIVAAWLTAIHGVLRATYRVIACPVQSIWAGGRPWRWSFRSCCMSSFSLRSIA